MPCDILVVEDNLDDLFLVREALTSADFDYHLTHNAGGTYAAAEIAGLLTSNSKPHVMILDYHLPAWTATELLTTFANETSNVLDGVHIIVLGGFIPDDSSCQLYKLGAKKVMLKPFDLDAYMDLGRHVRELCQCPASRGY